MRESPRRAWERAAAAILVACTPIAAGAATIGFEGGASSGGLVNVSPGSPYAESGFTLTVATADAAVFDSAFGESRISATFTATDAGLDDIVASVPEPATAAPVGLGLVALALARRRRAR